MQRFGNLRLIETNRDRFLVIKVKTLADYLAQLATASGQDYARRNDSFQNAPIVRQKSIPKSAKRQTHSARKSPAMGPFR